MESAVERVKALLGEPATQTLSFVYWKVVAPLFAQPTLHWMFIGSTILLAAAFYAWREGAWTWRAQVSKVFPKAVFGHPSAVLDYKFFVVNQFVMTYLRLGSFAVGLIGLLYVTEGVSALMNAIGGPRADAGAPPWWAVALFTLVFTIAYDFARFYAHFLHHRFPLLWEFHKVHHSAEVLTPFSSFRAHPVDQFIEFLLRLIATSAVAGVFGYFYASGIEQLTILNYGALTFFFYLSSHLRHSHVPMDFGGANHVLVSPLMHQLHHSAQHEHFDKNFGFIFSFWDKLAGTFYMPRKGETFTLGLPADAGRYDTVLALFWHPFLYSARLIKARRSASKPAQTAVR